MKYLSTLIVFFLTAVSAFSQYENGYKNLGSKYLAGAVPEVDGKVVFQHTVPIGSLSKVSAFKLIEAWNKQMYSRLPNQLLLSDPENYGIASLGVKKITFKKSALYVDETKLTYQIISEIVDDQCVVKIRGLKYEYTEAHKTQVYPAEDLIVDKLAINKEGTELARYYDKFRVHTVDMVNLLFNDIDQLFGVKGAKGSAIRVEGDMIGYKLVGVNKIPSNFSKLLADKLTLLTVEKQGVDQNLKIENGVVGTLDGQSVLYVSVPEDFDVNDTFTISFYTEAYRDALDDVDLTKIKTRLGGTSYSEAWMIIECKKVDKITSSKGTQLVGEIVSVWLK